MISREAPLYTWSFGSSRVPRRRIAVAVLEAPVVVLRCWGRHVRVPGPQNQAGFGSDPNPTTG